jgi:hypothetical protein
MIADPSDADGRGRATTSDRTGRGLSRRVAGSWRLPVACALLALVFRIPFLLQSDAFFNSDEAVQGLMARHVAELPLMFWGQGYKGVPDAYLTAVVFKVFGTGVVQLKSVTLGIWVIAVALTTRLAQVWYSTSVAILAGVFLATGPPALVYWSLCGNAEVAWLVLLISAVLLAYERSMSRPDRRVLPFVFTGCGLILWIHPIGICFVAGLGLAAALASPRWRSDGWRTLTDLARARGVTSWHRVVLLGLHVLAVMTAAAFLVALTGVRLNLGVLRIDHPQKIFREWTFLLVGLVAAHALAGTTTSKRRGTAAAAWFALGALPIALYALRGSAPGAAIATRTFWDLPRLSVVLVRDALPVVVGMRGLSSELITPWWLVCGFAVTLTLSAGLAVRTIWRRSGAFRRTSFAVPVGTTAALAIMLLPGGAFLDVTSYRYVMPYVGLAGVSAAGALGWVAARNRALAGFLAAFTLVGFFVGDSYWFRLSRPEDSDRLIIDCLARQGVSAARGDYWLAYRLTFRSEERLIVVPDTGPDRYEPYDRFVDAAPVVAHIDEFPADAPPGYRDVCTSSNLHASVAVRSPGVR